MRLPFLGNAMRKCVFPEWQMAGSAQGVSLWKSCAVGSGTVGAWTWARLFLSCPASSEMVHELHFHSQSKQGRNVWMLQKEALAIQSGSRALPSQPGTAKALPRYCPGRAMGAVLSAKPFGILQDKRLHLIGNSFR